MNKGLAYIGKISEIRAIEGADKVESAVVLCGAGGKWMGVVPKNEFEVGQRCITYLPDALLPQTEEFAFMERHKWRVSMRRFLGTPSEVLIMSNGTSRDVGDDVTELLGVKKYEKPMPVEMIGEIYGNFPSFIPKTDEPNFQTVPEMVDALRGVRYAATLKADGTSCTAYKRNGHFGVCSRNWELKPGDSVYWRVVKKYRIANVLRDGWAVQFEVVGPGIQGNPMELSKLEPRVFNLYDIENKRYGNHYALRMLCSINGMPPADVIQEGDNFNYSEDDLRRLAEVMYGSRPGEGIVIRPIEERHVDGTRLSFKVLNLLYKG